MNKLSIVMITLNSEKYLSKVLYSCAFANEVILLDSGSLDNTLQIAKEFKNVKISHQDWLGFGKQKQIAVNLSSNDWVFVLDSDEVITNNLKNELLIALEKSTYKAYLIARLNYFFGKPMKRCGLYPDYTLRFFNKNFAKFSEDEVHEKVITKQKTAKMKNHMLHFAYENIEEFIMKQNRYSSLNKKNNVLKSIFSPYWTFLKIYFLNLGFLEGKNGFIIAKLYAQYTFWKYIK